MTTKPRSFNGWWTIAYDALFQRGEHPFDAMSQSYKPQPDWLVSTRYGAATAVVERMHNFAACIYAAAVEERRVELAAERIHWWKPSRTYGP